MDHVPFKMIFNALIICKYDVQFSHGLRSIEWCNTVTVEKSKFDSNDTKISQNFSCGNAVSMRSRPTTPLLTIFLMNYTINKSFQKHNLVCPLMLYNS